MPHPSLKLTSCLTAFLAVFAFAQGADDKPAPKATRELDFRIGDGFGDAKPADIRAVVKSAAEELWRHCPNTHWEVPGFFIYHLAEYPITDYNHHADGRVRIGLTPQGNLWAQFSYQFGHEFCHALAGHSNDWSKPWIREKKANHWLEESLCETASLFVMRAMGKTWQTKPPYPNWKSYSAALTSYAKDRMDNVAKSKPKEFSFSKWFQENEESMRTNSTDRDKNNVVAVELLPLFEAHPAGWETLTTFNLSPNRDPQKTLASHFADWAAASPEAQREFIKKVAGVFGVTF